MRKKLFQIVKDFEEMSDLKRLFKNNIPGEDWSQGIHTENCRDFKSFKSKEFIKKEYYMKGTFSGQSSKTPKENEQQNQDETIKLSLKAKKSIISMFELNFLS